MSQTEALAYILLGALVAMISSMAGIGGGVFMVPLFYLALGMPINAAVGTSKAVIVVIATISTATYLTRGRVDLRVGTILMATTIPGSYLGAYLVSLVDPTLLEYIVSGFILWYSARLIYKTLKSGQPSQAPGRKRERGDTVPVALAGTLVGLVAGLTGTGGGALMVPLMISLLGMGIHEAIATSMYAMTMAAMAAAVRHHFSGEIVYSVAIPFAVGAVVGAMVGPRLALRMKANQLRLVIGVVLALVGLRMILG